MAGASVVEILLRFSADNQSGTAFAAVTKDMDQQGRQGVDLAKSLLGVDDAGKKLAASLGDVTKALVSTRTEVVSLSGALNDLRLVAEANPLGSLSAGLLSVRDAALAGETAIRQQILALADLNLMSRVTSPGSPAPAGGATARSVSAGTLQESLLNPVTDARTRLATLGALNQGDTAILRAQGLIDQTNAVIAGKTLSPEQAKRTQASETGGESGLGNVAGNFLLYGLGYQLGFSAMTGLANAFTGALSTQRTLGMMGATTSITPAVQAQIGQYVAQVGAGQEPGLGNQPFTPDILATGLYPIHSAQITDPRAIKAINDQAVKISAFTNTQDTSTISEALIQSMEAYGIKRPQFGQQSSYFADVITNMIKQGVVLPSEVGSTVTTFGSAAAQYRVPFSAAGGLDAALTYTTRSAQQSAQDLDALIRNIAAPNSQQRIMAKDLGITNLFGTQGVQMLGSNPMAWLQQMQYATALNPGFDIQKMFQSNAAAAVMGLIGPGGSTLGRTGSVLAGTAQRGTTEQSFQRYEQNPAAQFDAAVAQFHTAEQKFADAATPLATAMVKWATSAADFIAAAAKGGLAPQINKALGTDQLPGPMQAIGHFFDRAASTLGLGETGVKASSFISGPGVAYAASVTGADIRGATPPLMAAQLAALNAPLMFFGKQITPAQPGSAAYQQYGDRPYSLDQYQRFGNADQVAMAVKTLADQARHLEQQQATSARLAQQRSQSPLAEQAKLDQVWHGGLDPLSSEGIRTATELTQFASTTHTVHATFTTLHQAAQQVATSLSGGQSDMAAWRLSDVSLAGQAQRDQQRAIGQAQANLYGTSLQRGGAANPPDVRAALQRLQQAMADGLGKNTVESALGLYRQVVDQNRVLTSGAKGLDIAREITAVQKYNLRYDRANGADQLAITAAQNNLDAAKMMGATPAQLKAIYQEYLAAERKLILDTTLAGSAAQIKALRGVDQQGAVYDYQNRNDALNRQLKDLQNQLAVDKLAGNVTAQDRDRAAILGLQSTNAGRLGLDASDLALLSAQNKADAAAAQAATQQTIRYLFPTGQNLGQLAASFGSAQITPGGRPGAAESVRALQDQVASLQRQLASSEQKNRTVEDQLSAQLTSEALLRQQLAELQASRGLLASIEHRGHPQPQPRSPLLKAGAMRAT